ncbi:ABC-three component system middle component 2 [Clostridium baratii]|uniref:Uncharacterized protein n=1 Tax=Clostridium baratii TaxID=1561 RepID=A0A174QRK3_9CLOT|nr:ABC-three component system middle component 2 [Clostridium baratii]CUP73500.1 Uncharacterised protein [Clostridium baratii]
MNYNKTLNSPLEVALRALIILSTNTNKFYSIEKLAYLDQIITHMKDYGLMEQNLHNKSIFLESELITKQILLKRGLLYLVSKDLVQVIIKDSKIYYKSNKFSDLFLNTFTSIYYDDYKLFANIVIKKFGKTHTNLLKNVVLENIYLKGVE